MIETQSWKLPAREVGGDERVAAGGLSRGVHGRGPNLSTSATTPRHRPSFDSTSNTKYRELPQMPLALMSFHHILATKKIRGLKALTKKMSIDGVFRRGHPGVLLVSHPTSVKVLEQFTREVKTWRWASANVCGMAQELDMKWEHHGLEEREKVRDVVHEAERHGGPEVGKWVMKGLGLGPET